MYYKRSRSSVKGQGHSVKTSFDRHITALFTKLVAESKCNVRIVRMRSTKLAKTQNDCLNNNNNNNNNNANICIARLKQNSSGALKLQCIRNCQFSTLVYESFSNVVVNSRQRMSKILQFHCFEISNLHQTVVKCM